MTWTDDKMQRAKELCEKATPGDWISMVKPGKSYDDHGWRTIAECGDFMVACRKEVVNRSTKPSIRIQNNLLLLAEARTLLPEAIAEIERLQGQIMACSPWDDEGRTTCLHVARLETRMSALEAYCSIACHRCAKRTLNDKIRFDERGHGICLDCWEALDTKPGAD